MTRKQIKRVVDELVNLELLHQNPSSSHEEKSNAERRIMEIFSTVLSEDPSLSLSMEIDAQVQEKLNVIKEN